MTVQMMLMLQILQYVLLPFRDVSSQGDGVPTVWEIGIAKGLKAVDDIEVNEGRPWKQAIYVVICGGLTWIE